MWKTFRVYIFLFVITGLIYPLVITGLAQLLFKEKAKGSIIYKDGKPAGSEFIAQPFVSRGLFWSRPSAVDYNPLSSGGSNLAPTNPELYRQVSQRVKLFNEKPVSSYLVFASGSGLDPHLPPSAVYFQVKRVSKETGLPEEELKKLIEKHTEGRTLGIMGQERVNILKLNMELLKLMEISTHGRP